MKTLLLTAAAAAALVLSAPAQAAELVSNGGFEAGLTSWTASGTVDVATAAIYNPCCGTTGSEPAFSNNHFVAFGGGNVAGTDLVSQTFADVVGALYTFSFDIGAFGAGTNDITATVGGVSQTFTVTADNNNDTTFHTNGFSFVGTGSDAVKFTVVALGGDNTDALLDNVSVIGSVPEPATWAMMLTGFLGLGVMLRRRRLALA
jgi:hypothetical protein